MRAMLTRTLVIAIVAALMLEFDPLPLVLGGSLTSSDAVARIGRPATPRSAAGVARRTARRTTRRVLRRGAYYASLPGGCVSTTAYGYAVWNCGGTYYQSSGGGYVVVYFD